MGLRLLGFGGIRIFGSLDLDLGNFWCKIERNGQQAVGEVLRILGPATLRRFLGSSTLVKRVSIKGKRRVRGRISEFCLDNVSKKVAEEVGRW